MSQGERGFTLIELLIAVAIMGVLASVIIPGLSAFMKSSNAAAANGELQNVKSAAEAFYADQSPCAWPTNSTDLTGYIGGSGLKANYFFDAGTGFITHATMPGPGGSWSNIEFQDGSSSADGKWTKS